jgi:V/A-type H+-transporting ATPase subunit K
MEPKILAAFAAALSIGLTALATAWVQSKIGSAGAGALAEKPELSATIIILALAEKPELSATIIILVAIPETMVILGFVVAAMILFGG